ncbi:MAG TPA: 1-deoxy-D-xylulose-5-phosphate reductoisomerase [Egibacteraceae bacterium]|nr:1-deoxy-D-xylulose-5-phosphate reductoisomerase [Egibacteraceae bacterium]
MTSPQRVVVLGSTGSIGRQALDVIAAHPDRFTVTGLASGANADLLCAQARRFSVPAVALADRSAARAARDALDGTTEVIDGETAAAQLAATGADVVLNGIVGSRGLQPTLAALQAGSRLALANKESLILGGELVLRAARPGQITPVDSEHSALAQCLRAGGDREVARLVITASGGPFRGMTPRQLATVTVDDALAHPTWAMGPVITVNSATLANKGLEVIEAHLLFGVDYDRIDVVVHPQSVVHGMVEFVDGATMAKLSPPDMRLPIQLALGWPDRLEHAPVRMDWTRPQSLEFAPLDAETFPMVTLAVEAGRTAGTAPGVFNAANEEAVAAFLAGHLAFLGIAEVVAAVLEEHVADPTPDLETVIAAERWARDRAQQLIRNGNVPCS